MLPLAGIYKWRILLWLFIITSLILIFAGDTVDHSGQIRSLKFPRREGNFIKFGKVKSETSNLNPKFDRVNADGYEAIPLDHTSVPSVKRSIDSSGTAIGPVGEVPALKSNKVSLGKQTMTKHYKICRILQIPFLKQLILAII